MEEKESQKKSDGATEEQGKEDGLSSISIHVRKKELTWIVAAMVFIIVTIVLSAYLSKSTNTFTYQTLKFEKQLYGTIPVYVYAYTFKDITGRAVQEYNYQLLLRLDPRENTIPIQGEIAFPFGREIYVSVNTTGFESCTSISRDLASLSGFLTTNLFTVKGGVPDPEVAKEANVTHITCDLYPENTVLLFQAGNATIIEKKNEGCYVLTIANCQTLEAVEKFEVQSIIDEKNKKKT